MRSKPKEFLDLHLNVLKADPRNQQTVAKKNSYDATVALVQILGRIIQAGDNDILAMIFRPC